MRFSFVLLICLALFACGKTGALYLPEEPSEPQPQNTLQQNTEAQNQDTSTSEQAD